MPADFAAGPHSAALWATVQPTIRAIESLPFLNSLADGSLDARAFANYLLQDGLYLAGYARALALLAAKADDRADSRFWAGAAATAINVEEGMHQALLADARLAPARAALLGDAGTAQASPTTLGYVSWVIANCATGSYATGVAAVLPCFWIYAHVGKVLVARASHLGADHPYRTWVDTYDSADFDASTRTAVGVLEQELRAGTDSTRAQMQAAFVQASTYELHFWAMAHRLQGWALAPGND